MEAGHELGSVVAQVNVYSPPTLSEWVQLSWMKLRAKKKRSSAACTALTLGRNQRAPSGCIFTFSPRPEFPTGSDTTQLVEHLRFHGYTTTQVINYNDMT